MGRPAPFSPRLSGLNPVAFPFLAFLGFALSTMAMREFRCTVSLDVSQLAITNDCKKVCELIVTHFANRKIHAVQFVGTAAKVTFAVELSKPAVINHQALALVVFSARLGVVIPVRKMCLFIIILLRGLKNPFVVFWGLMGLLRESLFVIGPI